MRRRHLIKICTLLSLVALLTVLFVIPTAAKPAEDVGVVYDYANVLLESQEKILTDMANEYHDLIGDNHILVITTTDYDTDVETEARELGFTSRSDSCFVLLILVPTTSNGEWNYMYETYTLGDMSRFISDRTYYDIDENKTLYSMIKAGTVDNAAKLFITLAGEAALGIKDARTTRTLIIVAIAVVLGLIAGAVAMVIVWKRYNRKLRSASYPFEDFTRLNLTIQRDAFLDKSVIKTRISSGGSRGGGGGGFNRGGGGGRSGGRH